MNRAFERHAAYMDQAWRTLQDSVLLKTSPAKRRKKAAKNITQGLGKDRAPLPPARPIKDSARLMAERRGAEREALGEKTQGASPSSPSPLAGPWVGVTSEQHARQLKYAKFVQEQAERERANELAEGQARIRELERSIAQAQGKALTISDMFPLTPPPSLLDDQADSQGE